MNPEKLRFALQPVFRGPVKLTAKVKVQALACRSQAFPRYLGKLTARVTIS
jgi:hypothetical protein